MMMDINTVNNIRLNILLVPTGQHTLQRVLLNLARDLGFQNFEALLNVHKVKAEISHLRGNRRKCGEHNVVLKRRLTERQWNALYCTSHTPSCCNVEPNVDVAERIDISLALVLLDSIFKDNTTEEVLRSARNLHILKSKADQRICVENSTFEEEWTKAEASILAIASFIGDEYRATVLPFIYEARAKSIQELIYDNKEKYQKVRMLLLEPGQRILRSVFNVCLTKAGFKNREEMFENQFVQSEVVRKIQKRCRHRVSHRNPGGLIGKIFYGHGISRTLKESVKQCLATFDISLLYILLKDVSFLQFELSPYTKEGTFSFIEGLRGMYADVIRGFISNEMSTTEYYKYWGKCCDAFKMLMRFTGSSYTEDILEIENMEFHSSGTYDAQLQSHPLLFRVRLEFPPTGMSDYEFARTRIIHELRRHDKEAQRSIISKFDADNHDLIIVHHDKDAAYEACADFFDSAPDLVEIDATSIDENDRRNPVVCLVDPSIHRFSGRLDYVGLLQRITIPKIMEEICKEETYNLFLDLKFSSEIEKKGVYDALYNVLIEKVERLPLMTTHETQKLLNSLEKYMVLCRGRKPHRKLTISDEFENWLYSEIPQAVQCFSISNKIKIYIKQSEQERLLSTIRDRKFASESDVEFVVMNESLRFIPLFKPGSHIYIDEMLERHGSIGIYGRLRSRDTVVAISHGHVIQRDRVAYVQVTGEKQELGKTTYPPFDADEGYIAELSVIEVENHRVKQLLEEAKANQKKVNIFEGEVVDLQNMKVFKYGASTQSTVGFIVETDFRTKYGDMKCEGIVIEEERKEKHFAERGDSGALVFVPKRKEISAISLVYSEFDLEDHRNVVLTTKFSDCKNTYEEKSQEKIAFEGDHGLSDMCHRLNRDRQSN